MINSTQSLFANKRKYNHNSTTPNGRLPDLSNGAIFNDLERPLPPGFKVTPFFDAKYLRNGTIHRHSFNRILIRSYTRPIQQCRFEWPWVTLSDLAKYSMTRSVARSVCDSWASYSFFISDMLQPVSTIRRQTNLRSATNSDLFIPRTPSVENTQRHTTAQRRHCVPMPAVVAARCYAYTRSIPSCAVCLYVRLSVTFVYSVEMTKHIFKFFFTIGYHSSFSLSSVMAIFRQGPPNWGENRDFRPIYGLAIYDC